MNRADKQYIELLKNGDRKVLSEIYSNCYDSCLIWVQKHFRANKDDFEDIFQEAVIILYEAAIDDKLEAVTCTMKTYLFAICRNLLFNKMKLQRKADEKVEEVTIYSREWIEANNIDNKEQIALMKKEVEAMGEPCKGILTQFYYHNSKLDEIRQQMDYPNSNVVKVQKSRCLKYLREKLQVAWNEILS